VSGIVLAGTRWFAVKWWAANGREDLAERAALSVETLRKAGFIARVGQRVNEVYLAAARRFEEEPSPYATLLRVEVYGTTDVLDKAKDHLRGFWAAIESRGLKPDYQRGFETGVRVLGAVGKSKPEKLPALNNLRLKA